MTSIKYMRSTLFVFLFVLASGLFQSCSVKYSFTGAGKLTGVKTFSVDYFPNRARLVNPNLSQNITDALQEKLLRQTSLTQIKDNGDLEFSGQITNYDTRPMSIKEGDQAAMTRLTISVKVKYTNNTNHEEDWEKTFSAYQDFESSEILSSVEDDLIPEILKQITEDIFNASIANW